MLPTLLLYAKVYEANVIYLAEGGARPMAVKRISISVDAQSYEAFSALCEANGFKATNVIVESIAMPNAFIEFAISMRDKSERAKKAAQIIQLKKELGLSDADLKKLLKDSEQTETKSVEATTGMESIHTVCF